MKDEKKPFMSLHKITEIEILPKSDKYGHKKMLRELLEEYPEILDPSKLEPTEDGRGFYIIRE